MRFELTTLLFASLFLGVGLFVGWWVGKFSERAEGATTTPTTATPPLSTEDIGKKVLEYVNRYLVAPETEARLLSVSAIDEPHSVAYLVVIEYRGGRVPVYVTSDGRYAIFAFTQLLDLTKPFPAAPSPTEPIGFDAPDAERPYVELWVMSFCPPGNQAEDAMLSVVELLHKKVDFRVRYIASVLEERVPGSLELEVDGRKIYVAALKGAPEALQNLVELCVQKHYDTLTFWRFMTKVNKRCALIYRNVEELERCWKGIAAELGIDQKLIEGCAKGREGVSMLEEDERKAQELGIGGSPTLLINGVEYFGPRSPEAFKDAICSGFFEPPAECFVNLSAEAPGVAGRC